MSGGNIQSNESKHGNISWKYMLRNYSVKLMTPDVVDEAYDNDDTCGLITQNHVSNRANGAWGKRKCGECGLQGHSKGQKKCKPNDYPEHTDRVDRKLSEMDQIDTITLTQPVANTRINQDE